jgi:NodT family efflux transporter outer membrane factor (OMF) lipoprotein
MQLMSNLFSVSIEADGPHKAVSRICRKRTGLLVVGVCLVQLAGCANTNDSGYQSPSLPDKEGWSLTGGSPESAANAIRLDWWTQFGDAYLDGLVRQAIAGSQDVKILAARIDAAGIGLEQERVSTLPKVGLGASTDLAVTPNTTTRSYGVSLTGLNWEIDLWGKARKGIRAQQAEYKASEADYRAGYLSLVSEVASGYFQIRQFDEQIARQQSTLIKNQRILGILERQQREGLVPTTRVLQQQAENRGLQRDLLDLQRQRTLMENRLATLLGIPAGNLKVPQAPLSRTVQPLAVPAGLPADLLARRPDILAAEYRVLRAYELIGKARLAKLPSISLTGQGGLASAALATLLGNWTAGIGLVVNLPIFDPSLDLEIKRTQVDQQIAEEEYRRTVIRAFEEVENALVNLANRKQQLEELEKQLNDLRVVSNQVNAQLQAGLVSQLEVFESERTLLSSEQTLLEIKHQRLQDTVTLYKAMGGGWPRETVELAANR